MATQSARAFLEQVKNDESLLERISNMESDEVAAVAKELGFDVTADELSETAKVLCREAENERELSLEEMDTVTGGGPSHGSGIVDFFAWIACGFHHDYVYTGRTKTDWDTVIPFTSYQIRCKECGHTTWTRWSE